MNLFGVEYDEVMTIAEMEKFVKDNPHVKRVWHGKAQVMVGDHVMGVGPKNDSGFNDVMKNIASKHPDSPMAISMVVVRALNDYRQRTFIINIRRESDGKKVNKEIGLDKLIDVKPLTDNQKQVFNTWKKDKNQFLFGSAGTGKTFMSLYLALQEVLDLKGKADKVILVRSLIPTREIGFLFGR